MGTVAGAIDCELMPYSVQVGVSMLGGITGMKIYNAGDLASCVQHLCEFVQVEFIWSERGRKQMRSYGFSYVCFPSCLLDINIDMGWCLKCKKVQR